MSLAAASESASTAVPSRCWFHTIGEQLLLLNNTLFCNTPRLMHSTIATNEPTALQQQALTFFGLKPSCARVMAKEVPCPAESFAAVASTDATRHRRALGLIETESKCAQAHEAMST